MFFLTLCLLVKCNLNGEIVCLFRRRIFEGVVEELKVNNLTWRAKLSKIKTMERLL